jgi:sugar lactone lactonase YvrE
VKPLIAIMLGALLGGCTPAGVIFPPLADAPRWPASPERARVMYVGQLVTEADLKPGKSGFAAIAEALFGKKDVRSMLAPFAVCTDGGQRVFVADSEAQCVQVFDLDSRKFEQWRPGDPERPGSRRFSQPAGLAWDRSGKLYVADSIGSTIFIFDRNGQLLGEAGDGQIKRPCGIAIAPDGRVFVADVLSHDIVILSPDGKVQSRFGGKGKQPGQFNFPTYLTFDGAGRLYVADTLNFRVQQFAPDLKPLRVIGSQGDTPGHFAQPRGLAIDGDDHLYVVDSQFEAVQIFDSQGQLLLFFGGEGRGPGQFWIPNGIFIDSANRVWVADRYNRRIQVLDYVAEAKP